MEHRDLNLNFIYSYLILKSEHSPQIILRGLYIDL